MSNHPRSLSRTRVLLALAAGLAFLPACATARATPATTPGPAPPAGPYDVIIVGAGISGLAAARELRHLHPDFKLLVLEATNHVGGRGYTHKMASGTPIDLGGAWVHGVPTNPLTSLVDRMSFTRVKTDLTTPFYTSSGRAPEAECEKLRKAIEHFEERLHEGAAKVAAACSGPACPVGPAPPATASPAPAGPDGQARQASQTSQARQASQACQQHPSGDKASDYLPCKDDDEDVKYRDLIRGNSGPLESTAELDDTSAVDAAEFAAGEDDLVTQGMGEFVRAFGQEMIDDPKAPLAVRLEAPVTGVAYGERGVTVTATDHGSPRTYEGRRVLVTVSTGVLRSGGIAFAPPLPDKKLDAIKGLPMGLMNKIIFEFKEADALKDAPSNAWVLYQGDQADGHGHREVMAFALRPFGSMQIAIGFVGGDRAKQLEAGCKKFVDEKTLLPEDPTPHACDAAVIAVARDALRKMFPTLVHDTERAVYVTRWGLVSWARGAYSAASPGQWMMHEELGKPVPFPTALYGDEKAHLPDTRGQGDLKIEKRYRVFFAGEGCARPIYNGSFPGAYESGMVAARAIADSLEPGERAR